MTGAFVSTHMRWQASRSAAFITGPFSSPSPRAVPLNVPVPAVISLVHSTLRLQPARRARSKRNGSTQRDARGFVSKVFRFTARKIAQDADEQERGAW